MHTNLVITRKLCHVEISIIHDKFDSITNLRNVIINVKILPPLNSSTIFL